MKINTKRLSQPFSAGILATLLTMSMPASAAIVFSDTFDTGTSAAWGNERGNWRDTGEVYDATAPNNSPISYSSVTTFSALTDFALDVDVNDVNDGGIWLRSAFNGDAINGVLLVTGGTSEVITGFTGTRYRTAFSAVHSRAWPCRDFRATTSTFGSK